MHDVILSLTCFSGLNMYFLINVFPFNYIRVIEQLSDVGKARLINLTSVITGRYRH